MFPRHTALIVPLVACMTLPATLSAQVSTSPDSATAAAPVADHGGLVTATPEQIAQKMLEAGFATTPNNMDDGTPKLDGRLEGWSYSVYFYGCDSDNRCDAIQFAAGFDSETPFAYDPINDWNAANRYGRAYLDNEQDPWVEMDIHMEGAGISEETFEESLAVWRTVMTSFVKHIGW